MVIRAVIWDLGGVLVRTVDFTPRNELAKRFGMSRIELEALVYTDEWGKRAQVGEISLDLRWEKLSKSLDIPLDQIPVFLEQFWGCDLLDAGLVDYVRSLRPRYKTALLSNAFSDLRRYITKVWKFADAFDEIIVSAEVGLVKPDPRIYYLVLERLGVVPAEAVFIDDFMHNVQGAQAVNMHAIHFQNPVQVSRELQSLLDGR
jgi:epoxide hydrolase-like predicted phosphatase